MKFIRFIFVLLFFSVFIVGCSPTEESSSSNQDSELTIYTSVYPIKYAVEQIAGNTATVETVFPPGTDAHTYEPTSKDIIAIAESDAFIYLGSGMESFSDSLAESLGSHDVKLIEMGQYDELFHHDHHRGDEELETENIEVTGLLEHYHTRDSIKLTAKIEDGINYDHLHWFSLNPDEEDWVVLDEQTSINFEDEAEMDGQQIKAVLYGNDHDIIAESEPVTIEIDDHEGEHHHSEGNHEHGDSHEEETHHDTEHSKEINVGLEGLLGHYHTGDSIKLSTNIDETVQYDHLHWFLLHPYDEEWIIVDGQTSNNFESDAEMDGQQIKAVLYNDDHDVVAESEPVTIKIDDHGGDYNPHIWIDPLRMIEAAEIIKDQLIELNPGEEEKYTNNFIQLKEKLTGLDTKFMELLSTKKNKAIIVSHAAFGYWEERYGITQIAINGLTSSEEPSQKQLTEIIVQSKKHDLEYVLFEQNSSNRLAEVIQDEIGATALTLHNLEVLTQNDMDKGEDYLSLMEHNLDVLDQATK
jgi:zinc transport system substrate-binding protein